MRAFLLCLLFQFVISTHGHGESLVLGFDQYPASPSTTKKSSAVDTVFAALTSGALTTPLLGVKPGMPEFQLGLTDSLEVSPDLLTWKFKLRAGAVFTNGTPLLPEDVKFSIERCAVRSEVSRVDTGGRGIAFVFPADAVSNIDRLKQFPVRLADCPIWERESGELFGERLGYGTTFVGTGPYLPTRAEPGKRIILTRLEGEHLPESIELRAVTSGEAGLQQLRGGGIDLLATEDAKVLVAAEKDETLLLGKCSIYSVVVRRGLRFACTALSSNQIFSSETAWGYEQ